MGRQATGRYFYPEGQHVVLFSDCYLHPGEHRLNADKLAVQALTSFNLGLIE